MSTLNIFKVYLLCYFLMPIISLYFALLSGIIIPFWIEIVPLFFLILFRMRFTKLVTNDVLFIILIVNSVFFIVLNLGDYSWLSNIEIRAFIFIGLNYYIFRCLLNPAWSENIAEFIIKILKFSMYLAAIEFFIINTGGVSDAIEDRYLAVFDGTERLYEYILFFTKPLGLYPGTHNLGVASLISILYLIITKSINNNKGYFIVSIFVFFVGFSLTITLALMVVLAIHQLVIQGIRRKLIKKIFFSSVLITSASLIFKFGGVLSQIKAYGKVRETYSEAESNVYINSISNSLDMLYQFPLGTPLDKINLYENEIYILSFFTSYFT